MKVVRQRDVHRVHGRLAAERLEIRVSLSLGELRLEARERLLVDVAQGRNLCPSLFLLGEPALEVCPGDPAAADQTHSKCHRSFLFQCVPQRAGSMGQKNDVCTNFFALRRFR